MSGFKLEPVKLPTASEYFADKETAPEGRTMSSDEVEIGQKMVGVRHKIVKERHDSETRWLVEKLDEPTTLYIVGLRTVYSGKTEIYEMGGYYDPPEITTAFSPHTSHHAILAVKNIRSNPFYISTDHWQPPF